MNARWRFYLNVRTEKTARRILGKVARSFRSRTIDLQVKKHERSGNYVASFENRLRSRSWPGAVVEALGRAQHVARGWIVLGDIGENLEAFSREPKMPYVLSAELMLSRKG